MHPIRSSAEGSSNGVFPETPELSPISPACGSSGSSSSLPPITGDDRASFECFLQELKEDSPSPEKLKELFEALHETIQRFILDAYTEFYRNLGNLDATSNVSIDSIIEDPRSLLCLLHKDGHIVLNRLLKLLVLMTESDEPHAFVLNLFDRLSRFAEGFPRSKENSSLPFFFSLLSSPPSAKEDPLYQKLHPLLFLLSSNYFDHSGRFLETFPEFIDHELFLLNPGSIFCSRTGMSLLEIAVFLGADLKMPFCCTFFPPSPKVMMTSFTNANHLPIFLDLPQEAKISLMRPAFESTALQHAPTPASLAYINPDVYPFNDVALNFFMPPGGGVSDTDYKHILPQNNFPRKSLEALLEIEDTTYPRAPLVSFCLHSIRRLPRTSPWVNQLEYLDDRLQSVVIDELIEGKEKFLLVLAKIFIIAFKRDFSQSMPSEAYKEFSHTLETLHKRLDFQSSKSARESAILLENLFSLVSECASIVSITHALYDKRPRLREFSEFFLNLIDHSTLSGAASTTSAILNLYFSSLLTITPDALWLWKELDPGICIPFLKLDECDLSDPTSLRSALKMILEQREQLTLFLEREKNFLSLTKQIRRTLPSWVLTNLPQVVAFLRNPVTIADIKALPTFMIGIPGNPKNRVSFVKGNSCLTQLSRPRRDSCINKCLSRNGPKNGSSIDADRISVFGLEEALAYFTSLKPKILDLSPSAEDFKVAEDLKDGFTSFIEINNSLKLFLEPLEKHLRLVLDNLDMIEAKLIRDLNTITSSERPHKLKIRKARRSSSKSSNSRPPSGTFASGSSPQTQMDEEETKAILEASAAEQRQLLKRLGKILGLEKRPDSPVNLVPSSGRISVESYSSTSSSSPAFLEEDKFAFLENASCLKQGSAEMRRQLQSALMNLRHINKFYAIVSDETLPSCVRRKAFLNLTISLSSCTEAMLNLYLGKKLNSHQSFRAYLEETTEKSIPYNPLIGRWLRKIQNMRACLRDPYSQRITEQTDPFKVSILRLSRELPLSETGIEEIDFLFGEFSDFLLEVFYEERVFSSETPGEAEGLIKSLAAIQIPSDILYHPSSDVSAIEGPWKTEALEILSALRGLSEADVCSLPAAESSDSSPSSHLYRPDSPEKRALWTRDIKSCLDMVEAVDFLLHNETADEAFLVSCGVYWLQAATEQIVREFAQKYNSDPALRDRANHDLAAMLEAVSIKEENKQSYPDLDLIKYHCHRLSTLGRIQIGAQDRLVPPISQSSGLVKNNGGKKGKKGGKRGGAKQGASKKQLSGPSVGSSSRENDWSIPNYASWTRAREEFLTLLDWLRQSL